MPFEANRTFCYDIRPKNVQWQLNDCLYRLIRGVEKSYDSITVLCIGSDRLIGDCYGPLTGHMLSGWGVNVRLYGTLETPVHALSLHEILPKINIPRTLIIAVDSSVGREESIGRICMGYDPVRPGSGLGKQLPEVGDISITGIVASGESPFIGLQNAPLGLIYKMAEKTAAAIRAVMVREPNSTGTGCYVRHPLRREM